MVIKGIPFRIWEKVIRLGTGFFFITAVISPFLALILYVFEPDFEYLLAKSESSKRLKQETKGKVNYFQNKDPHTADGYTPYIPIPDIHNSLSFKDYNYRPDCNEESKKLLSLSIKDTSLLATLNEKIYLNCEDFENISFTKEKSPYSITPISITDDKLQLNLEVTYTSKDNKTLFQNTEIIELTKTPQQDNLISPIAAVAMKRLQKALYFTPDKLISILGGNNFVGKKDLCRLYFKRNKDEHTLYIKAGDYLSFENDTWVMYDNLTPSLPLVKIDSLSETAFEGTFWNENGFFQQKVNLDMKKPKTAAISNFSFDKLYKRNQESVICKISDKTFILKSNDWLVRKGNSWSHIVNIEEFNDLINFKCLRDIIIFDKIKYDKENEIFMGYIFDESRSNYKKLEIVLKKNDDLR